MFPQRLWYCARCAAWAAATLLLCAHSTPAQEVKIVTAGEAAAQVQTATPAQPAQAQPTPEQPGTPGQPMPMPGQPTPGQPMPMGTAAPGATPATTTTRPAAATIQVNPEELKVEPDKDGKIQFSFNGQPWPDVLEWFARISNRTLDWQELPADYLNLTLNRPYTLDEARDLLNRHLLARGFTFIEHEVGFSVVKIDKINPALVPRVSVDQLDERMPYEYVKVSFNLKWLMADELVKELEPLKSPNGKLVALSTTNRIEAMDAVINLREIKHVLGEEQSDEGRSELVREFPLEFVKAADIQKQLEKFLGIESPSGGVAMAGMSPEQQMMMQQQQAQMAAQAAQMAAQQPGGAAPAQRKVEMRLVADPIRNRIIAHGPPDKIALIESFIRVADVPPNQAQTLEAMLSRVRVYRLASLDPDQFVLSLSELGGLDPLTRVRPDPKNNAIIVDGSLVDHYTIKSLIEKLDGSGRRFEVIQLRRHSADEVAGSIELLMGGDEEESTNNRRSYYSWDYYGYGYGGNRQDDRKKDKFRVGANVEYNQLLLWANDIELEEVRKLLVKLGEITDPAGGGRVRTIEIPRGESPADVLKRLREIWPSISPNPLELPPAIENQQPEEPSADESPQERERANDTLHDARRSPSNAPTTDLLAQTLIATTVSAVSLDAETDQTDSDQASDPAQAAPPATVETPVEGAEQQQLQQQPRAGAIRSPEDLLLEEALRRDREQREQAAEPPSSADPPPVRVTIGPDGNIVISSQDTEALNLLQQLLEDSLPPARNYHVFRLENAPAFWVRLNLEDFFKEDEKSSEDDLYRRWWYGYDDSQPSDNRRQLGKPRKLKFIDDLDTNTIVVVGADEEQLETIAELIKLYDVPEQVNSQNTRVTKLFPVRYSKASAIAATLKDTFIDLLSSNDRALQGQNQQNERPTATVIRNYGPPPPGGSGEQQQEKRTQISFKGKLAIGVDDITNTLIVSAEGESLLNIVGQIIEQLDRAAMPESHVEVIPFVGNGNYERLQKTLSAMLATEQPNGQAQQGQPQGQPPPQYPYPYPPQQPPQQPAQPIIVE